MSPSLDDVAAAVEAWLWIPDYATTLRVGAAVVIRYPDHLDVPLVIRMPAPTGESDDAVERLLDDALVAARGLGHPWVAVQAPLGAPAVLERSLVRRGASVLETLDVLAADPRGLTLDAPTDVDVRAETEQDLGISLDGRRSETAVFGGAEPSREFVVAEVAGADDRRRSGEEWRGVAYLGGRPAGVAGCVLVDGVLRLWGGAVLPEVRGRGVYRALLAARVAWGLEHSASMALVKGRVETSGPVLRRAGFTAYGTTRDYRLEL